MPNPKTIRVVFLDAGGTLFQPFPSVGHVYAEVAQKHGVTATPEDLERLFRQAWHARNGLAAVKGVTNDKLEREWWYGLVREVFIDAKFARFDAFFDELYDDFAQAHRWRLYDDTVPFLNTLRQRGLRVGMISNWDHRLFGIIEGLRLGSYFEHIIASSAVGISKPAAGIFEAALERFGVDAIDAIHVGDSLEDDYLGAQNVGMRSILLNRHRKAYNGVTHIASLRELISALP